MKLSAHLVPRRRRNGRAPRHPARLTPAAHAAPAAAEIPRTIRARFYFSRSAHVLRFSLIAEQLAQQFGIAAVIRPGLGTVSLGCLIRGKRQTFAAALQLIHECTRKAHRIAHARHMPTWQMTGFPVAAAPREYRA